MSEITAKATTEVIVNGKQANAELDSLKKQAVDLQKQIDKVGKTEGFNSKGVKKLQRELDKVNKQINTVRGNTELVNRTLANLNTARPHELRLTLRRLKTELQGIQRGTAAWDAQVTKIRMVDRELKKVNADLVAMKTPWEKFKGAMGNGFFAIVTALGIADMFVQAARNAVNAFAAMDQEMASVRKFTGMTEEEVVALNEEFKKIDTRTSREELNKLAQEAGRLGLQSQEDVLGFVRAANQINVALDDLGDGATLTLSKLTDIFGDKQRLGVEQSLLSVGSVINELSQNCTASAPYLAQFASRMGGVGAQAGMTIPQVMAFGAVLDSQNQKLEASATAVSQVITRLYRDPAKYAKVAGLDVQNFTKLLKEDANEALLTLLEKLNKAGGMDVLSPMFADMGENGARAISALSTLAKHVDEVRSQQVVAAEAFREATSVTEEYNIQNNTAQAKLEKAKKGFQEMTIELGQKLMPVMRYVITSGSAIMRILSGTISFIANHKALIIGLAASIGVYTVAVKLAALQTKALDFWEKSLLPTLKDAKKAVIEFGKAIGYGLTGNIAKAKQSWLAFSAALKANPIGLIAAAAAALGSALYFLTKRTTAAAEAEKTLNNIRANAAQKMVEEKQKIDTLMAAANNMNLTYEEQQNAVTQLNKLIPNFNGNINATTRAFSYSAEALEAYNTQLAKMYELEGAKEKLKELGEKKAGLVMEQTELARGIKDAQSQNAQAAATRAGNFNYSTTGGGAVPTTVNVAAIGSTTVDAMKGKFISLTNDIKNIEYQMKAITDVYGKDMQKQAVSAPKLPEGIEIEGATPIGGGSGGGSGKGGGGGKSTDKLAALKAELEKEKALLEIKHATGVVDERKYAEELFKIQEDYYTKVLARTDLTEQERLDIRKEYAKLQADRTKQIMSETVADENAKYAEQKAEVEDMYLSNLISKENYDSELEKLEIYHLIRMANLYEEGTKERLDAERKLREKLIAQQTARQKETEDLAKKHEEELKRIKEKYFGLNETERKAAYDKAVADLKEAYDKEIAAVSGNEKETERLKKALNDAMKALAEEYDVGEATGNILDKMAEGVNDWLKGDGGKALTGTIDFLVSNMSSLFSQLSSLVQAEAEIEQAKLDKRYDKEISRAEGNNQKVKALERKKAEESAKIKSKAAQKEFNMQVIMAIAQTAQAGLNAYSSTAAIPIVGPALAPAALAIAVATGMLQVAALKKQKEAAEAQGYAAGGFTPDGPKYREAGIVHAGEWVASQELVKSPVTRPVIDVLEAAQRNNTIPSPRRFESAVSRSSAAIPYDDSRIIEMQAALNASLAYQTEVVNRLASRLDEPFVTVNTVTGDTGIKRAQDDYQAMINRTLPKSRRK